LLVPHAILTNEELAAIKYLDYRGWKTKTIDITYPNPQASGRCEPAAGDNGGLTSAARHYGDALRDALQRICSEATQAIADGFSLIILSDRALDADRVAVSSLLACGAVHRHLVRDAQRTQIGIVLETG